MDILDKFILDNTIKSYLIVLSTILFLLLIKKYLSHYIASLLFLIVKRNWSNIQKKDFVALIVKPLSWFITISISIFAIDKLNFPEVWIYKIYGHPTNDIVDRIGLCLIIVFFFWFFVSLIDFIALIFDQRAKFTHEHSDKQLVVFFRDLLKVITTIFGILMVIKAGFHQNISSIITGLSIVGAAVALAAKESLENLIASFVIFFDKPFYTGDNLKVNNVTGTVEHIGLRSTRIRTQEKTLVTVPNKQMVDSLVDNLSMRTQRRAEIKLDFDPKTTTTNIESLIDGIKKILLKNPDQVQKYSVFFSDFNKNGVTVTVEYFTIHFTMAEFNTLKQSFNIAVKKLVEDLKMELASGEADINIFSGEAGAAPPKNQSII
jgi:MscS family membrane protein